MLKQLSLLIGALATAFFLAGCQEDDTVKQVQAKKAAAAANSIQFVENAEIDNIKRRLELTSSPGLLGYIVLLNDAGQPIFYGTIKGKPTSGGKRLTRPDEYAAAGANGFMRQSASDEGTYGTSAPYIFFWTTGGQYMQWSGEYLFSDKPFRLSIQPLVVAVESSASTAER